MRGGREEYTWPQLSGDEEERTIPGPSSQERRKRGVYLVLTVRRGGREEYTWPNCQERRKRGLYLAPAVRRGGREEYTWS